MTVTDGPALERFVRARWARKQGGIRGLARALHVAPDRLYAWFRGSAAPDTDQLAELAALLGVRRYEIVAAMDGEAEVVALNAETRAAFLALMDEWAALRGVRTPRREGETGNGAA